MKISSGKLTLSYGTLQNTFMRRHRILQKGTSEIRMKHVLTTNKGAFTARRIKVESEVYFDIVGLNNNNFQTQNTEMSSWDLLKI